MKTTVIAAFLMAAIAAPAHGQDKPDFTIGGLKWRCERNCGPQVADRLAKIEQKGDVVTFTDKAGNVVTGTAKTEITRQSGARLRCQMNPSFCGPEDKAVRTTYYRSIVIPAWNCTVSVQQKDGETNTAPPFKAQWMRFLDKKCVLGDPIMTTLSARQVKAIEKKCGEWGVNC